MPDPCVSHAIGVADLFVHVVVRKVSYSCAQTILHHFPITALLLTSCNFNKYCQI